MNQRASGGSPWLLWLAAFLLVEIPAAVKKGGGTLSENAWAWFSIREHRRFWLARRCALGLFMAVLTAHFLTGGAYPVSSGAAVAIAGAPIGLVIVLSAAFERQEKDMGGLLGKLAVKILKARWGSILPAIFKAAAEGQFGEAVKRVYWWLAGKKTITGAVLFGAGLAFEGVCSQYPAFPWSCTVSRVIYDAGAVLIAVGLIDGGTRSPWPNGTPKLPEDQPAK